MNTENLSVFKIHKLSQAQYDRESDAGRIDETALYLTPDVSPADHVIAEGISGDDMWYYRKWSNGWAECWSIAEYSFGWFETELEFFAEQYYTLPFPLMMYPFVDFSANRYAEDVQNIECHGSNDETATEDGGVTRIVIKGTPAPEKSYINTVLHVHVAGFWKWEI